MDFNEGCRCCMYICQKHYGIDILPQAKEERGRETEREREVTLLAEWQWPSCIASPKWRGGGGWREGECHFQVSPRHSPLMRDGFCSTDSQGDQGKALPTSSSFLSSTPQISNPPRSWQLKDPQACVSSTCTTSFPHHNNNKGRRVSVDWYCPCLHNMHILRTSLLIKTPALTFSLYCLMS